MQFDIDKSTFLSEHLAFATLLVSLYMYNFQCPSRGLTLEVRVSRHAAPVGLCSDRQREQAGFETFELAWC